jgi:multidrug resistance efflux pump
VKEVVAEANAPLKKGDVIFTIDPEQFEFDVKRLEAALAAAEQGVPQLKSSVDQATAAVERAKVQQRLANEEFQRQEELFQKNVVAQAVLDRAQRNLDSAQQAVAGAEAAEDRARLAYQSNIGSENTAVAQARQQLEQAKYNVEESVVRAPCDGYATNIQLVPGAVVSSAASVVPFVCERDETNRGVVVASFMQGPYLHIHPGDYAEVVFPMYPGEVFPGKVITTIDLASEGQLSASGLFPGANAPGTARFAVRIKLDDADTLRLPAGTQGNAAVYTGQVQVAGIIRMALMRVTSWANYLFFTA